MSDHFKLWLRQTGLEPADGYSSKLHEISGINDVADPAKETLICLPGYSSTHSHPKEINGYMSIAQQLLGGREVDANLICVSYPSTEGEAKNIEPSNNDPLHYTTPAAREFARNVLLPLIEQKRNINILAKSYGSIFYQMSMNALAEEEAKRGITHSSHQIRLLTHAPIKRRSLPTPNNATEIYVEGTNDERLTRLNSYKEPAPHGHKDLTIVPLSTNRLQIYINTPDKVRHWNVSATAIEWRETKDPDRHTTRMYTSYNGSHDGPHIMSRVLRNMLTLKGDDYNIRSALYHRAPLAPERQDIPSPGSLEAYASARINQGLNRGIKARGLQAVLFDWDMTIANGDKASFAALQRTFEQMEAEGFRHIDMSLLNSGNFRKDFFTGTTPDFFDKECNLAYNGNAKIASDESRNASRRGQELFLKYRAETRSEVSLLPGAKELLISLHNKGVKIGVVSNKTESELKALRKLLLPDPCFNDMILAGEGCGIKAKPAPDLIYIALDKMGIPRDEASSVMFVGDQISTDIAASLAAGCKPCLIGASEKDELFATQINHKLAGGREEDHALLLDKQNRRVWYVEDLFALNKQLDRIIQANEEIARFYKKPNEGFRLGR